MFRDTRFAVAACGLAASDGDGTTPWTTGGLAVVEIRAVGFVPAVGVPDEVKGLSVPGCCACTKRQALAPASASTQVNQMDLIALTALS
jgi:hypothetical protein